MLLIPQCIEFFFLPFGVLIFAWFIPSILHWTVAIFIACALWEVRDVFEKDNKIGQNEELHLFSSHGILFRNINNKGLFTTNIYQTIPERENYLKNPLTSFLLADEERALEKCKLGMTQISKC